MQYILLFNGRNLNKTTAIVKSMNTNKQIDIHGVWRKITDSLRKEPRVEAEKNQGLPHYLPLPSLAQKTRFGKFHASSTSDVLF